MTVFQSSFIIQPFLDGFLQHFLSEGFGKEVVATCFQGSLLVVLVGIGCKCDDGDVRYQFTDDASGVDSAKVGHFHIHQDEVGVDFLEHRYGFHAVFGMFQPIESA